MIQYSECLVDTNTTVYNKKAKPGYRTDYTEIPTGMTLEQKALLLEEKRNTIVYGYCSMDQSPREHAREIALLAAETGKWEVFLRAHLDIMNDYFQRNSDGNYALAGRKTHIREIELMNVDIEKLIIGTSIRTSNEAKNHYFSSISRTGRALAEAKNRNAIRNTMIRIIKDKNVDLYNRMLMYYLFSNYISWITNNAEKSTNIELLKNAITSFDPEIELLLKNQLDKK
jgi:hypothetical protein